jgi:anti-sigma B factor antagonist
VNLTQGPPGAREPELRLESVPPDPGRRIRRDIDADGATLVSQYLNMRMSHADGCVLAWLGGEIDVAEAAESRAFLLAALGAGRPCLVVDVTDVTFIDASGLGVLVFVAKTAARDGGWLRLVGASPLLSRILRITRLGAVLPVYDTVRAATAAVAPGAAVPRPRQGSDR